MDEASGLINSYKILTIVGYDVAVREVNGALKAEWVAYVCVFVDFLWKEVCVFGRV